MSSLASATGPSRSHKPSGHGSTYPGVPWEPKQAFGAVKLGRSGPPCADELGRQSQLETASSCRAYLAD